jgi:hypothetical protein
MDVLTLADELNPSSWVDVALAMLNVVQTVALAYLAADRHSVRAARSQGQLTRATDPPPAARE